MWRQPSHLIRTLAACSRIAPRSRGPAPALSNDWLVPAPPKRVSGLGPTRSVAHRIFSESEWPPKLEKKETVQRSKLDQRVRKRVDGEPVSSDYEPEYDTSMLGYIADGHAPQRDPDDLTHGISRKHLAEVKRQHDLGIHEPIEPLNSDEEEYLRWRARPWQPNLAPHVREVNPLSTTTAASTASEAFDLTPEQKAKVKTPLDLEAMLLQSLPEAERADAQLLSPEARDFLAKAFTADGKVNEQYVGRELARRQAADPFNTEHKRLAVLLRRLAAQQRLEARGLLVSEDADSASEHKGRSSLSASASANAGLRSDEEETAAEDKRRAAALSPKSQLQEVDIDNMDEAEVDAQLEKLAAGEPSPDLDADEVGVQSDGVTPKLVEPYSVSEQWDNSDWVPANIRDGKRSIDRRNYLRKLRRYELRLAEELDKHGLLAPAADAELSEGQRERRKQLENRIVAASALCKLKRHRARYLADNLVKPYKDEVIEATTTGTDPVTTPEEGTTEQMHRLIEHRRDRTKDKLATVTGGVAEFQGVGEDEAPQEARLAAGDWVIDELARRPLAFQLRHNFSQYGREESRSYPIANDSEMRMPAEKGLQINYEEMNARARELNTLLNIMKTTGAKQDAAADDNKQDQQAVEKTLAEMEAYIAKTGVFEELDERITLGDIRKPSLANELFNDTMLDRVDEVHRQQFREFQRMGTHTKFLNGQNILPDGPPTGEEQYTETPGLEFIPPKSARASITQVKRRRAQESVRPARATFRTLPPDRFPPSDKVSDGTDTQLSEEATRLPNGKKKKVPLSKTVRFHYRDQHRAMSQALADTTDEMEPELRAPIPEISSETVTAVPSDYEVDSELALQLGENYSEDIDIPLAKEQPVMRLSESERLTIDPSTEEPARMVHGYTDVPDLVDELAEAPVAEQQLLEEAQQAQQADQDPLHNAARARQVAADEAQGKARTEDDMDVQEGAPLLKAAPRRPDAVTKAAGAAADVDTEERVLAELEEQQRATSKENLTAEQQVARRRALRAPLIAMIKERALASREDDMDANMDDQDGNDMDDMKIARKKQRDEAMGKLDDETGSGTATDPQELQEEKVILDAIGYKEEGVPTARQLQKIKTYKVDPVKLIDALERDSKFSLQIQSKLAEVEARKREEKRGRNQQSNDGTGGGADDSIAEPDPDVAKIAQMDQGVEFDEAETARLKEKKEELEAIAEEKARNDRRAPVQWSLEDHTVHKDYLTPEDYYPQGVQFDYSKEEMDALIKEASTAKMRHMRYKYIVKNFGKGVTSWRDERKFTQWPVKIMGADQSDLPWDTTELEELDLVWHPHGMERLWAHPFVKMTFAASKVQEKYPELFNVPTATRSPEVKINDVSRRPFGRYIPSLDEYQKTTAQLGMRRRSYNSNQLPPELVNQMDYVRAMRLKWHRRLLALRKQQAAQGKEQSVLHSEDVEGLVSDTPPTNDEVEAVRRFRVSAASGGGRAALAGGEEGAHEDVNLDDPAMVDADPEHDVLLPPTRQASKLEQKLAKERAKQMLQRMGLKEDDLDHEARLFATEDDELIERQITKSLRQETAEPLIEEILDEEKKMFEPLLNPRYDEDVLEADLWKRHRLWFARRIRARIEDPHEKPDHEGIELNRSLRQNMDPNYRWSDAEAWRFSRRMSPDDPLYTPPVRYHEGEPLAPIPYQIREAMVYYHKMDPVNWNHRALSNFFGYKLENVRAMLRDVGVDEERWNDSEADDLLPLDPFGDHMPDERTGPAYQYDPEPREANTPREKRRPVKEYQVKMLREDEARFRAATLNYRVVPRSPDYPLPDGSPVDNHMPRVPNVRHPLVYSDLSTLTPNTAQNLIVKIRQPDGTIRNPTEDELVRSIQKERPHYTKRNQTIQPYHWRLT